MYCTIWEDIMDLTCPPNGQHNLSCRIYSPHTLGAEYNHILKKILKPQVDMLNISYDVILWKEKKEKNNTWQ